MLECKVLKRYLSLHISVRRPFCPKFLRLKCIIFKNCGKLRRFCTCVRRYYGDEAENDDQVNDVIEEDGADEVEETS